MKNGCWMRYFEDMIVGETRSFGQYEVKREEVIDFASKFDPQPFHLDDDAAAKTHFGRLAASGWHTAGMTMRMMVDSWEVERLATLGSPGIDELNWYKPVYPGDVLRVETELLSKRRSKGRPDMGLTRTIQRVFNQHNDMVMSFVGNGMVSVRHPEVTDED